MSDRAAGLPASEIRAALQAREIAQNHFDIAEGPEQIDAAVYELTAAELRLRAVIRMARADTQFREGRVTHGA